MGIYISNMKMPRFCCECPLKESMYDVGFICLPRKEPIKVNLCKGRDDACPLVPLPEGHGRLVDADALMSDISFFDGGNWHYGYSVKQIQYAPTILEAEGGGEDGN